VLGDEDTKRGERKNEVRSLDGEGGELLKGDLLLRKNEHTKREHKPTNCVIGAAEVEKKQFEPGSLRQEEQTIFGGRD